MKNQSFWKVNETYEPLPELTIIKKGYRSVVNSHGQSEQWVLVRDSQNNKFLFHGEIGNFGLSFDIFPLHKISALPNIDTDRSIKAFLKEYYAAKQKPIPLLLSKKDYNKLADFLTFGALEKAKCVCCGEDATNWWCDFSGKYCYKCAREKSLYASPYVITD